MLGVSNDAEMSAIQSVGKRRLMALRLDDDADPGVVRRIESALETLADPVERFEWGLLAPELTDAEADAFRADPILSTLSENPQQEAVSAYERICEADNAATRAHNVGVLKFVQAVAATEEAQKGTPDDISDDLECVELWKVAYRNLRLSFGSDKFWMRQRLRAKGYQDQRLDAERIKRIQSGIFREMVQPVGEVIRHALLDRHGEVAKAYVDLIRKSGFDGEFLDEMLSEVYKPLADRVEKEVQSLEGTLESAGKKSASYTSLFRDFEARVLPDIDVMLAVGDLPGYAEEHARDVSAAFLRSLAVQSCNEAENFETAEKALQVAKKIVDSKALGTKLEGDAGILSGLIEQHQVIGDLRKCCFCKSKMGEDRSQFKVAMFKITGRKFGSVSYKSIEVPVPRCGMCKSNHDRIEAVTISIGLVIALISFVIAIVASLSEWSSWGFLGVAIFFVVGVIASFVIVGLVGMVLQFLANLFSPTRTWKAKKHPLVKKLRSDGFQFGDKPRSR